MNLRPLDWLGWLLAIALCVGFFLPWLKMPYRKEAPRGQNAATLVKRLTTDSNRPLWQEYFSITPEEWQHALQNAGMGVSGVEIPRAFQGGGHRLDAAMVSASGLLGEERQADRAMLVLAFPVLAVLSAAFITLVTNKLGLLLPLLADAALYGLTRYQLNTTSLERLAMSMDLGLGLWLSLYALLGLIVVLLLRLLLPAHTQL